MNSVSFFSTVKFCTWKCRFSNSIETTVTQLVNFTDLTLWLCALGSSNASRSDWLASRTTSVSSKSANVFSASLLLLSPSSSACNNSFLLLAWAAGGQMLASVEPDAIYFRLVPQFFCVGVLQREVPVVADWMSWKFGGGCFGSLRSGFDFGR